MRHALALIGLLCVVVSAEAAEPVHSEIKFVPYTSGGRITGCGIEFVLVFNDSISRDGKLAGISGSYSWMARGPSFGGMFKVAGLDLDKRPPAQFKIETGTLRIGGRVFKPDANMRCDREQNYCAAYTMESSIDVFGAIIDKPAQVGFNRVSGGLDIMLPIAIPEAETLKLLECMNELMNEVSANNAAPRKK